MKGGENLGNEEGSEETSEEDREKEVSPTRIYTPEVRPLISGVFLCSQGDATCAHVNEEGGDLSLRGIVDVEQLKQREMEQDEAVQEKRGLPVQERHVQR